jgi:hypothetical protein
MKRSLKIIPLFVVAAVYRKGETAGMYPKWKRWRTKALTLGFLLFLLAPAAHAQEASGVRTAQANPAASDVRAKPDCVEKVVEGNNKPQCISDKVKSLRLNWGLRVARGFQYDFEVNEQSGTVLVDIDLGDETITRPIRNPQSYLQKHTLTFKFGELFPERLSMFKRASEYLKKHPQAADPDKELSELMCGNKPLITCLTKGGSWWKRALMGTSVNLTLSERAKVVSQLFVTDPRFGKDFQVHGGFAFDPAKLFPTATSWKSAFDEVHKVDKALAYLGATDVVTAIDANSGRRPWKKPWAAAIIPKVEFKVLSQFDFLKFGGELREARFPNRALNTWKFTWDLTRAIPDTKSRIDADVIDETLRDLKSSLGTKEEEKPTWQKQCILHLPNGKVRKIKDLHPAFKAESCQGLANLMEAGSYQLSCVPKGKEGKDEQSVDGPKRGRLDDPTDSAVPPGNECKW